MPPAVTLSVQLNDSDGFACHSYTTCYAPFVVIRLVEGTDLFLRDVATADALAAVVADARHELVLIEASSASTVA